MQKHIEAKHINHGPESCHYCEKQCASKQALQKHVSRYHREILFQIYILLPVYFWEIYFIQTKVVYLLGISNSNSGSPQERPVITKVQVKKSLLKTIGNAKQCLLCNKVFSREKEAVGHVYQLHQDILQSPDDITKLSENRAINSIVLNKKSSLICGSWKCKFCSKLFTSLEDTVPHMRLMHGVTRGDARNKSIQRIS